MAGFFNDSNVAESVKGYGEEVQGLTKSVVTEFAKTLAENKALSKDAFAKELEKQRLKAVNEMRSKALDFAEKARKEGDFRRKELFKNFSNSFDQLSDLRNDLIGLEDNALQNAFALRRLADFTGVASFANTENGDFYNKHATQMTSQ